MIIIRKAAEPPAVDLMRSWNVFFSDGDHPGLWRHLTRPGFRHVEAAAYFADQDRWVFVLPARLRLGVFVLRPEEAEGLYSMLWTRAAAVLRVEGSNDRWAMPIGAGCVGTVKALLGVRSRAFSPYQLFRHLLREGAEILHGQDVDTAAAAAGPGGHCDAAARGGAGPRGSNPRDTGSASGRDPASQPA